MGWNCEWWGIIIFEGFGNNEFEGKMGKGGCLKNPKFIDAQKIIP